MIPRDIFLENLILCSRFRKVEGSIVECGVWRGGMIAAMAEVIGKSRKYYLFDSFEGLPPVREIDGVAAMKWQKDISSPIYFDNCKAEVSYAKKAMESASVKNYEISKGWFSTTIPAFLPNEPIAVLRIDCDWYDSVSICFNYLFKYVAEGGIIIIDDYYTWEGCSKAVHDFLSNNKLPYRIRSTTNGVAYIIKSL